MCCRFTSRKMFVCYLDHFNKQILSTPDGSHPLFLNHSMRASIVVAAGHHVRDE